FHERYGVISTVVTRTVSGPVADSQILTTRELGAKATDQQMIDAVLEIGAERRAAGVRPILLANADFLIMLLAAHREELEEFFHLPIAGDDVLEAVADKATFSEICTAQGVPT